MMVVKIYIELLCLNNFFFKICGFDLKTKDFRDTIIFNLETNIY